MMTNYAKKREYLNISVNDISAVSVNDPIENKDV
jgi:hypothetical protein